MTKRKTELTTRQKSIIRMITQFSHQNPVTVKAISEKLGLSSRTILREMPDIENWMTLNDFKLVKKPRVGLYLDEEDETKVLILELIDLDKVKFQYSKKERKRLIVEDILSTEEPRKFFYFTSKYGISDRTLGSDLDELETWMASYGIELVRKPGFGVYWSGNEENYRQAVNSLIVELCGGRKLRLLLQEEKRDENQDPLLMPYDRESVASVEDILRETQERLKIQYTDNAFNGLLVYLMVSIQRMKEGKMVVSQGKQPDALLRYHERQEAARVANELEKVFNIKVSRAEIMFIAVQLISAKIWQPSLRTKYETENFKTRQAVIRVILKMEEKLSLNFMEDEMLIDGLCNHIGPAISRIKLNIRIENSHLDMVKGKYAKVYQATVEACDVLKEEIGVGEIPEEEIGFIAMYFCVSIEQYHSEEKKVSVVVACPNGIGTSRMLSVYLSNEFPEIEVKNVISSSELQKEGILDGIDLVISTMDVDTPVKHVCVNPVLLEQDRMLIRETIQKISKRRQSIRPKRISKRNSIGRKEIEYVVALGQEILQVIDNVKISNEDQVYTEEELLTVASQLFARNDSYAVMIENDLREREKVSDTYISSFQMKFYHCVTEAVDHCRFGYLSLRNPHNLSGRLVIGAIIMLIPEDEERQSIHKCVMSEISGALADNENIVHSLQERNREGLLKELEKSLGSYYQKVMKKNGE